MTAQLSPVPVFKAFGNDSLPLAFGYLYSYAAGTTTPQPTYTDYTQGQANTNPIQLNARGECALWLDPTLSYKLLLTDANGNTIQGYPVDQINGILSPSANVIPQVDNVYNLGSTTKRWANGYFYQNIYFGANNSPLVSASGNAAYYARTAAEIAATVTPTDYSYVPGDVRRYGGVAGTLSATADGTTAFNAAISSGYSPTGPAGYYGISTTLVLSGTDQIISCPNGQMILVKYANVPVVNFQGQGSGLKNVAVYGNYGIASAPTRPAGAPSFSDTTDNITIGTTGNDYPFFWVMDQVISQWAGRDGIHHFDGPGGQIGVVSSAYNARWGYTSDQITSLGGSAVDTAHVSAKYLHCFANGIGQQNQGGNIYLQGAAHAQFNCKSFGSYGDGFRMNGFSCNVTVFSELDGSVNTAVTTWAAGQTIAAIGTWRKYGRNTYYSTNTGVTGATPPTNTSGTQSDGTVIWQYRQGISCSSDSNSKNQNIITLMFANGYHSVQATDVLITGDSFDGQTIEPAQTAISSRIIKVSREVDLGSYSNTGDFSNVALTATLNTANQFDWAQNAAGGNPMDVFWGRGGSTTAAESLRFRGGGYGFLADVPHGGRVVNVGDVAYSLNGKSCSEGDTYWTNLTTNRDFNFDIGGIDLLPGRKILIMNQSAHTLHIYSNGQSTTLGAFGSGDANHNLTNAGDWLLFTYLGSNFWIATGKKAGAFA